MLRRLLVCVDCRSFRGSIVPCLHTEAFLMQAVGNHFPLSGAVLTNSIEEGKQLERGRSRYHALPLTGGPACLDTQCGRSVAG